ncbi:GIY-YIG nuclease family protein [Amphritea balenae]|uniref:Uncharacterized protein n=1 Tax=Amphritea balenae TaxID=452629 RepID=A0A3P1SR46_9GAMM|nr:GIY-YIG nuclease family protein [Amphritea balenae]RRC99656.1 hypothetical protein EHS89_09160 [Amphritea balenae]GGK78729.1 hypothetical protein GCM10007941_31220 [Amphritea balenae]
MIVFTITNTTSEKVYVGSTRSTIDQHWETLLIAAESGVDHPLYDDIRRCGGDSFNIAEWAIAEDLQDLRELTREALETYDAASLQGLRTKPNASTAHRQTAAERKAAIEAHEKAIAASPEPADIAPLPTGVKPAEDDLKALAQQRDAELAKRIERERKETAEMAKVLLRMDARKRKPKAKPKAAASTKPAQAAAKPKLATGKASSAKQEKKIREQLEQEREARQNEKMAKQRAEAKEMAEVMARIDARAQAKRKTPVKAKPKSAIRSSGRKLSLNKPAALKETTLELDRNLKQTAERLVQQQELKAATPPPRISMATPSSTPAIKPAVTTVQKPVLSKTQRIETTIDRYRARVEKNSSPVIQGQQDLKTALQSRLAQRNNLSTS